MKYLQFKYSTKKDLYLTFRKLLELKDCRIYISKNLYLEFLHYLYELTDSHYICTGILKFPKLNKIIFESNRVRDGIFYIGIN
mgnify:CR=1 FL=1